MVPCHVGGRHGVHAHDVHRRATGQPDEPDEQRSAAQRCQRHLPGHVQRRRIRRCLRRSHRDDDAHRWSPLLLWRTGAPQCHPGPVPKLHGHGLRFSHDDGEPSPNVLLRPHQRDQRVVDYGVRAGGQPAQRVEFRHLERDGLGHTDVGSIRHELHRSGQQLSRVLHHHVLAHRAAPATQLRVCGLQQPAIHQRHGHRQHLPLQRRR